MAKSDEFKNVFEELKNILEPYEKRLTVTADKADSYCLETSHVMKNKQKLFFAGARIGKNYVSYYLMPVYGMPALLKGMSPKLKKRMQGKSCFNFTSVDKELFAELRKVTKAGFEAFNSPAVLKKIGIVE